MKNIEYYSPKSIEEFFSCMEKTEDRGRIIAGGTNLMLSYANNPRVKKDLVDISGIKEIYGISQENAYLYIGAVNTHEEIASSSLVKEHAPLLAKACSKMGSRQIRNMGTVGGNIVTAFPAADSLLALVALEAECEVYENADSSSWLPCKGLGKVIVKRNHLLSRIRFKIGSNYKMAYQRMSIRKELSFPILNVAVVLVITDNIIEDARVAVAPAVHSPLRASAVEAHLKGKAVSMALLEEASSHVLEGITIRSSSASASKEYREKMLPVYVLRALKEAAF